MTIVSFISDLVTLFVWKINTLISVFNLISSDLMFIQKKNPKSERATHDCLSDVVATCSEMGL